MFDEWILPNSWQVVTAALAIILHQRSAWRLHLVMVSMLFSRGRKTVTSWFRVTGIIRQYKAFYLWTSLVSGETSEQVIIQGCILDYLSQPVAGAEVVLAELTGDGSLNLQP